MTTESSGPWFKEAEFIEEVRKRYGLRISRDRLRTMRRTNLIKWSNNIVIRYHEGELLKFSPDYTG